MVGSVLNMAKSQTGSVKMLSQLRSQMDPADWQQIQGVLIHELGLNPSGEFSLRTFARNLSGKNGISDRARAVLFDPQHAQFLDDIANLGAHLRGADNYSNKSGTGRAVALAAMLSGGGAIAAGGEDAWDKAKKLGAASAGGLALAGLLSRPSGAASTSAWALAHRSLSYKQNPVSLATFNIATRNLAHALSDHFGLPITPQSILNAAAAKDSENTE
jgi:hypothetical protein